MVVPVFQLIQKFIIKLFIFIIGSSQKSLNWDLIIMTRLRMIIENMTMHSLINTCQIKLTNIEKCWIMVNQTTKWLKLWFTMTLTLCKHWLRRTKSRIKKIWFLSIYFLTQGTFWMHQQFMDQLNVSNISCWIILKSILICLWTQSVVETLKSLKLLINKTLMKFTKMNKRSKIIILIIFLMSV